MEGGCCCFAGGHHSSCEVGDVSWLLLFHSALLSAGTEHSGLLLPKVKQHEAECSLCSGEGSVTPTSCSLYAVPPYSHPRVSFPLPVWDLAALFLSFPPRAKTISVPDVLTMNALMVFTKPL